jgi:hypothetical protein
MLPRRAGGIAVHHHDPVGRELAGRGGPQQLAYVEVAASPPEITTNAGTRRLVSRAPRTAS